MSQQLQITGGAKVRSLEGVITGSTGVLGSLPINGSNGIPQLDSNGKILVSQLPNSVMEYLGTWNAATNTPTLVNGTGNAGDVYLCNVAGTVNFGAGPITFYVGDQVIYSGTIWQRASGATGSVTSVAVTETGDALTITGSPITTSGTINIGFAGTSAQYVAGNGSLVTFPTLTGYVPYTGATGAVNLGAYDLTVNELTVGKGTNSLSNNTALGHQALFHITTGNYNTGVGHESLHNTSTGQYNTAIGQSSLFTNTTGSQNTALGLNALLYNTSGGSNVVVGLDAMQHNTTGGSNTALGYNAGSHITGGSTPNTTASNSVYIGRDSKAKLDGQSNEIVIGYNAIGNGSNTATFGNSSITANYFTGSINGGSLDISGTGRFTGQLRLDSTITNGTYTYTLPSATGTLAIRSDLDAYVTLATSQVITGAKVFDGSAAFSSTGGVLGIEGGASVYKGLALAKGYPPSIFVTGFSTLYSASGNNNAVFNDNSNTSKLQFQATSSYTYTFPANTGTVALTSDIPVNSVTSVTATSPLFSSGGLTPNITIQVANTSQNGYLSSTDWNTFNGKQNALTNPITGTGVSGRIPYFNGTTTQTSSANLSWDNTNNFIATSGVYVANSSTNAYMLTTTGDNIGSVFNISATRWGLGYGTSSTTLATAALSWNDSGNVSIGNTNNTYKLDVTGTGRFTGQLTLGSTITNGSFTYTLPSQSGTFAVTTDLSSYVPTSRTLTINGTTYDLSANRSWTVSGSQWTTTGSDIYYNTGNVGIGLTNPAFPLEVSSTSTTLLARFTSNQANAAIRIVNSSSNGGRTYSIGSGDTTSAAGNNFYIYDESNGALRFAINNSGNVGIGTSSPPSYSGYTVLALNNATNGGVIDFQTNGTRTATINNDTSNFNIGSITSLPFLFYTNGSERMRITSGGQVQIKQGGNTFADGFRLISSNSIYWGLVVGGDNNLYLGYNSPSASIGVFNNATGIYTATSDINKKKDFEDSTIGLNAILGLKPKLFRMKTESNQVEKSLGFIAQEVKEFIPQAYVDSNNFIGLNDRPIIAALVKAIQELKLEIDELKNK